MQAEGNIRKMLVELGEPVQYHLPLYQNLEKGELIDMTSLVGKDISIQFDGQINCAATGKTINKTFGDGLSYDAWRSNPQAVESIIHPELDQSHLGIGLRDLDWERDRHAKPHFVYLALTSNMKVGVTKGSSIPSRWIDQGAWKVMKFAETPYRQKAGAIEVELKAHISDKTNWRKMLTDDRGDVDFTSERKRLKDLLPIHLKQYVLPVDDILEIKYPVLAYPEKVKSIKLDSTPIIESKLMGIRGQYLLLDEGQVINLRSHAGYRIKMEA